LGQIDTATGVADQQGPRHLQAWDRLPAAGCDGAGSRGEDLAPFEQRFHRRMMLELLKGLEWRQARILVVEPDDESDIQAILVEMVDEAAAVGGRVERPAEGVLDQAGLDPAGRYLPQLLHPQPEALWAAVCIEAVPLD